MKKENSLDDIFEQNLNGDGSLHSLGLNEDVSIDEADELASLLGFAASLNGVLHPQPSPAVTRAAKLRLFKSADEILARNVSSPVTGRAWLFGNLTRAMAFFIIFILVIGFGFWQYGPVAAHAATLADVSGVVEVANSGSEVWRAAALDETLSSGSRVRSGSDGSVTMAFFEGTRVNLEPNSELILTNLAGKWDGVLQVELAQVSGIVHYNVRPFNGKNGTFSVKTPSGIASVLGTNFDIKVGKQGQTLVAVDNGRVKIVNENGQADVLAGEANISESGHAPFTPEYRFSINSSLSNIDGKTLKLANISILINQETQVTALPQIGQAIFISGRINQEGQWVADLVDMGKETKPSLDIVGVVEKGDNGVWTVSGITFLVHPDLVGSKNIQAGNRTRTELEMDSENQWQAKAIADFGNSPENVASSCMKSGSQPKAEKLAEKFGLSYGEVSTWACQGFGYGEIDLAYELSIQSNTAVADIFALRRQPMGWGQVKEQLGETPTVVVDGTAITPPVTPVGTSVVGTPIAIAPDILTTPSAPQPGCTGADPQPEAQVLARQYGIEIGEIMGWFCDGFGFGEIRQAYDIQKQTGTEAIKLFAMKKSGLGWGEIQKFANQEKNNRNNTNSNNSNSGNNGYNGNNGNNGNKGNKGNNGNNGNNGNTGNNSNGNPPVDNGKKK